MKQQNVSIYLRKANLEKYKELADIFGCPVSSMIAQVLQMTETINTLDNMIKLSREILAENKRKEEINGEI